MEFVALLIVAALVFGVCFLADKGFKKVFRSQEQHASGKAVRLSKRYGTMGLLLTAFGTAVLFAGLDGNLLLLVCGIIMIVVGIGLIIYYMTFGVFYNDDSFLLMTFGKPSKTYAYRDIQGQKLYITTGNVILVELYLSDGRTFQLQSAMEGAFDFLDKAFFAWLEQTGRTLEECSFHDPKNSCWFPSVEE